MGLKERFKRMTGGSKTRDSCTRDPNTGEVTCVRKRVNNDGTEVDVAGFTMTTDASCTPVTSEAYENEDGQLKQLENKFVPKIIGKCNNVPPEY